jgi:hypothetical protein
MPANGRWDLIRRLKVNLAVCVAKTAQFREVVLSEFPSVAVMHSSESIGRLSVKDNWRGYALNFTGGF